MHMAPGPGLDGILEGPIPPILTLSGTDQNQVKGEKEEATLSWYPYPVNCNFSPSTIKSTVACESGTILTHPKPSPSPNARLTCSGVEQGRSGGVGYHHYR